MRPCSVSPTGHALRSTFRALRCLEAAAAESDMIDDTRIGMLRFSVCEMSLRCRTGWPELESQRRHLSEKGVPYHVNQVPNSAPTGYSVSFLLSKLSSISTLLGSRRKICHGRFVPLSQWPVSCSPRGGPDHAFKNGVAGNRVASRRCIPTTNFSWVGEQ